MSTWFLLVLSKPVETVIVSHYSSGPLLPLYAQEKNPHTYHIYYSYSKECLPLFLSLGTRAFSRDPCFPLGINKDSLPLGSASSLAYPMNENQPKCDSIAQCQESSPLFCNAHLVTFHVWSPSLRFHRESCQTSPAKKTPAVCPSDLVIGFSPEPTGSTLGIFSTSQVFWCVLSFCPVLQWETEAQGSFWSGGGSSNVWSRKNYEGRGQMSQGTQTCNYEKSSGLASIWSLSLSLFFPFMFWQPSPWVGYTTACLINPLVMPTWQTILFLPSGQI